MSCGCEDECCIIDYYCITKHTPLNNFTDESDLITSLKLAQLDVKNEIIGVECYELLCEQIDANAITAEMQELIKAIEVALSWKTFEQWLTWYANVKFADSVTTKATDRQNSSAFANIDAAEKAKLIAQANSRYETYKNIALKEIKELNLPCSPKETDCTPCTNSTAIKKDNDLSHLPDVV